MKYLHKLDLKLPSAESPQLLMIQNQLVSVICHLSLNVHHPLQPGVQIDTQLFLGLGTSFSYGKNMLMVPHHHYGKRFNKEDYFQIDNHLTTVVCELHTNQEVYSCL